jgi:heptosyltransferase-2/heptosyltransferase-3
VVLRFGAMGDLVLLLPLLRMLAAHAGQPVSLVTSGSWARPLLAGQDAVGEIRVLTSRNTPYWFNRSQQEFVHWLSGRRGATVYVCETDHKSLWMVRKAGVLPADWRYAGDHPVRPGEHWMERWLRLGSEWLGQTPPDAAQRLQRLRSAWMDSLPDAQADARRWLQVKGWAGRPLVLVQPGNKRTMRRGAVDRPSNAKFWPKDRWVALCHRLRRQCPQAVVLFCGSPEEAVYTTELAKAVGDPAVVSVAHELPIPRLLALQALARVMVSVDTGPAHSAAAQGCPLVVLFGAQDPGLWRPYAVGAPVEVVQAMGADGQPAMAAVTVDAVMAGWARAVGAGQTGPMP